MLGRLLKYDLKQFLKFLSVFYILGLFFAVLTRLFLNIDNSLFMKIVGEICRGAAFSMLFSAFANNILRLWVKFRQSVYGDESYLTHTLPVEKHCIYSSKMLTAVITAFVSLIVLILGLFVIYYSKENADALKAMISPILNTFDISLLTGLVLVVFVLYLEFINILQCGFTGIILGHRFNNGKLGMSVLFGFIIYMLSQITIVILMFIPAIFNSDFMNIFVTTKAMNLEVIKFAVVYSIISYIVINIVGFLINIKLFNKGVNVD